MRTILVIALLGAVSCDRPDADTPSNDAKSAAAAPDNTKVNERDRDDATKTPFDQAENKEDVQITAHIRQEVIGTDGLSSSARNVKIITADGVVTLRGPVDSASEKVSIAAIAKRTEGVKNVIDEIEVAAN